MEPRTRNALLITAVAILAIGLAAATLTSTVEPEPDGGGGNATGEDQPSFAQPEPPEQGSNEGGNLGPAIDRILVVLMSLGMLGFLAYMILYRRQAAAIMGLLILAVAVFWLILQYLGNFAVIDGFLGGGDGLPGFGQNGESSSSRDGESQSIRNLLFALVVIALLVITVYIFRSSGTDGGEQQTDDEGEDPEDVAAMGEIAGQAADRIETDGAESERVDNEVYWAYREMTAALDVPNQGSTTPREFASAAAERGMASEDVDALTDLFEEVRYGGYRATPDREQQAVDTLRRIEQRYQDE